MAEEAHNGAAAKATVGIVALKPQVSVPAARAEEAVVFYKAAFGAEEVRRATHPKRKAEQEQPLILCAELKIGSSAFLVCDQFDEKAGKEAPIVSCGIVFRLETDDVEAAVAKAVKAGAVLEGDIMEDEAACGGGLLGKVKDPFGVEWDIASPASRKCSETEAQA